METIVQTVAGNEIRLTERGIASAASRLGFEVRKFPVSKAENFDVVFGAIVDARSEATVADFTALTFRAGRSAG